ncbi:hypothetical protein COCSADRAFT_76461 [Bipolaris sorokiniana ND90Pr]|uniref:Uncharacterized protein n=1 Tax=Cochliobolus sativus (strain ND90Pr / ATCC 201652) TaxID=665912 RepID=M2T622_COCSN|nr:uncharacterized protein COCSADRAFT_76461 [Bipolaris sorokiniana ND90Pr]EMD69880.1 hypothetical protein COCSADRAFT_76461 [Bipolaris sorokiniana ND90Pr]
MDGIACIQHIVRDLKADRDTWQAVACQYKAAFEAQTARLRDLQDVCFATQAELENERAQQHRGHAASALTDTSPSRPSDGFESPFGTATIYSLHGIRAECSSPVAEGCVNPLFNRVHECAHQRNYGTALSEVERLLRGPLGPKARAEGLLLKSNILRALGPDDIFDALAVCSEAIELCSRLAELESFLPKIQRQQNLLRHDLRALHQASDMLSTTSSHDDLLLPQVSVVRKSYDDELDMLRCAKRRSGFDENRTMEGLLVQLEEKAIDNKRRRTSARLRLRAAAKARRMSVPYRWVKARGEGYHRVS